MHDPPPGLDEWRHLLADRVRAERRRVGLSQERLAHAAGLGVRTVIRLESGRHAVGIDALYAVAHALSVPVAVLVAREGPLP
ncbi:helix-turn-helix domain-containing protein [Streptomyces sp. NPDC002644]